MTDPLSPSRLAGTLLRRLVALMLALAGGTLLYFFGWLVWTSVLPQVRETGWSLRESNMILNRDWVGNQLYLLCMLYFGLAIVLLISAFALWRGRQKGRATG